MADRCLKTNILQRNQIPLQKKDAWRPHNETCIATETPRIKIHIHRSSSLVPHVHTHHETYIYHRNSRYPENDVFPPSGMQRLSASSTLTPARRSFFCRVSLGGGGVVESFVVPWQMRRRPRAAPSCRRPAHLSARVATIARAQSLLSGTSPFPMRSPGRIFPLFPFFKGIPGGGPFVWRILIVCRASFFIVVVFSAPFFL